MVPRFSYRIIFALFFVFGSLLYFFSITPVQATAATFSVAASADDVLRTGDSTFSANSIAFDSGNVLGTVNHAAARFTSINIPQGSTINSAYFTVVARGSGSGTNILTKVYAENIGNATQITSASDFDGRSLTTGVDWDMTSGWSAGSSNNSPDITSEIQAVVNQSSWVSGNSINIFWKDDGSAQGNLQIAASQDHTTYSEPTLTITWTEPAAGGVRDHTPPVLSNGKPAGTLGDDTTETTLSFETDERAICRYSVIPFVPYELMLNAFSTGELGGMSHSAVVAGLSNGNTYKYYIKCKDQDDNVTPDDFLISFSIASDDSPPIIFADEATLDQNLPSGTTQANLVFTTNESAICRYSAANTSYALMTNTFSNIGGTSHSVAVAGLSDGNSYVHHVKCSDTDGNANTDDFIFSFAVASVKKTLFVKLTANPESGEPPLNDVDLTASVSNTAAGAVKYTFYCNRADDGLNITSEYKKQYINAGEEQKAQDLCDYEKAGTYYAKVIAEREGVAGEARAKITVSEKIPGIITKITAEDIKNEITKIQQKIIELIQQLILLIQAKMIQ